MKISITQKYLLALLAIASTHASLRADCYAHTIFVPRQLAYNPIYEDALVFDEYAHMDHCDEHFLFSIKPIYTQTVGNALKKYFNINHARCMNVQENGSGDIDSLWFQVISAPDTFYSSALSFSPVQRTYGAMLYVAWNISSNWALTLNTAGVRRTNDMNIHENNIVSGDTGQVPGFTTVTQSLASCDRNYGRICGMQSKGGIDDIQIKLIRNLSCDDESFFADVYGLLGIPTGRGSKAKYLFEPMVGSKHAQLGLGLNAEKSWDADICDRFSLYGELKWRYAFKGKEIRSFDMTPNGQWSRYMLLTTPTAPGIPFFAINDLTFKTYVTPRNSFDMLLAAHFEHSDFSLEVGYNLWYRQAEKVSPWADLGSVGIADLVGIAQQTGKPTTITTASTATISEGVYPNQYQMARDASYTLVTAQNINRCSGAQAACLSNAVFGAIGYEYDDRWDFGVGAAYEKAANTNTASTVSAWVNVDVRF